MSEDSIPSLPQSSLSILEDDSYFDSALGDLLDARLFDLCSSSLDGALEPSHSGCLSREPEPEKAEDLFLERSTSFGVQSESDFSSDLGFDWIGDCGYNDAASSSLFGYQPRASSTLNSSQNSYQSDASRPVLPSISPPSNSDSTRSDTASMNVPAESISPSGQSPSASPNQRRSRMISRMAAFRCSSCQKSFGSQTRLV